jgi:hypothetical protein
MKSQFMFYHSTLPDELSSSIELPTTRDQSIRKPNLSFVFLMSLLAAIMVQPARSQSPIKEEVGFSNTFGPSTILPQQPGSWSYVSMLISSFEKIDENTIILRAVPIMGGSGLIDAYYFNPYITRVSFDWMLMDDNPGGEGPDFRIQAGYRDDFVKYDLYNGSTTLPHSGSVSLENLSLQSFGFYTNVTGGSSKLEITNLNFTVIPEPASYALILSFVSLLFVAVKRRPASGVERRGRRVTKIQFYE